MTEEFDYVILNLIYFFLFADRTHAEDASKNAAAATSKFLAAVHKWTGEAVINLRAVHKWTAEVMINLRAVHKWIAEFMTSPQQLPVS